MYARTSSIQFQPGAKDEALAILQNALFPSARQQHGFQGAWILQSSDPDKALIVTFWESEADLQASRPSPEIEAQVQRLGDLIAENVQGICQVVLRDNP